MDHWCVETHPTTRIQIRSRAEVFELVGKLEFDNRAVVSR